MSHDGSGKRAIARLVPMNPDELLDDQDEPTRPDCTSGVRRKASFGTISYLQMAQDHVQRLELRRPHKVRDVLLTEIKKCYYEFDSWHIREPTSNERNMWIIKYTQLHLQAQSFLCGDR